MRIGIFGSYNGGSIGDTAILLGMISSISRVAGEKVEITLMAMSEVNINEELEKINCVASVTEIIIGGGIKKNNSKIKSFSKRLVGYFKRKVFGHNLRVSILKSEMARCDILLIGGGNLLMDLYPGWPPILKKICKTAYEKSVPYFFVGVGAGPINTTKGAEDLEWCIERSRATILRDGQSKNLLEKKYGFRDLKTGPDLAFGILFKKVTVRKNKIAVNAAAVYSREWPVVDEKKYFAYIKGLANVLIIISEKLSVREVVIFNTNYPLDYDASKELKRELEKNNSYKLPTKIIDGKQSVSEVINICSSCRYSLVTRLHAGILSSLAGTFVMAISYQPKVSDVLVSQVKNSVVDTFDSVLRGDSFVHIDFENLLVPIVDENDRHTQVDVIISNIIKTRNPLWTEGLKI